MSQFRIRLGHPLAPRECITRTNDVPVKDEEADEEETTPEAENDMKS
jgi:hypothetical protein